MLLFPLRAFSCSLKLVGAAPTCFAALITKKTENVNVITSNFATTTKTTLSTSCLLVFVFSLSLICLFIGIKKKFAAAIILSNSEMTLVFPLFPSQMLPFFYAFALPNCCNYVVAK